MVAAGSFEVAADAPGIARYRRESTDASEAVSGVEGLHVSAGGGEEFGAECARATNRDIYKSGNMIKVLVIESYCATTDLLIMPYYVRLNPSYCIR